MSKKTTEASKEAKEIWQSGKDAKEAASKMKAEKLMKDPLLAYQGRGDFSGVRPPAQSTPVKKKEGTMKAPVTTISKDLFKGGKRKTKKRKRKGGRKRKCCKCKRCTKKCPCKRKSKCLKRCKCMKRKTKRKYKKRNQRGCNRKK